MPTRDAQPDPRRVLHESQERFIALWGQMATSWGIPRTMAEIHALLFLADEPLNTDDIMTRLGVSRGAVIYRAQKFGLLPKSA